VRVLHRAFALRSAGLRSRPAPGRHRQARAPRRLLHIIAFLSFASCGEGIARGLMWTARKARPDAHPRVLRAARDVECCASTRQAKGSAARRPAHAADVAFLCLPDAGRGSRPRWSPITRTCSSTPATAHRTAPGDFRLPELRRGSGEDSRVEAHRQSRCHASRSPGRAAPGRCRLLDAAGR